MTMRPFRFPRFAPLLPVCLFALPLVFCLGCSRIGRDAAAKDAARTEHESADFTSLDQLTADVERPAGAAEILMFHFAVKGPKDRWLEAFNAAFCRDLGQRVTRLPQVRGQVPVWEVTKAMSQHGISDAEVNAASAIKAARVGGRHGRAHPRHWRQGWCCWSCREAWLRIRAKS
jgi:hypothetical protein